MKPEFFKIEKNRPLPDPKGKNKGALRLTMESLKAGDSFLAPVNVFSNYAYYVAEQIGIKISIRKEAEGKRIWRIK